MPKNPFEEAGLRPMANPFEAAGFKRMAEAAPVEAPGMLEAGLRGAGQGVSLGFSDEITGALGAIMDADSGESLSDAYSRHRDESRAANDAAKAAHSGVYGASELGGSVASMFIPGLNLAKGAKLGATIGKAALAGGIGGAGYSDADSMLGLAADTALGAGVGGAAGGIGHGIASGVGKIGDWAGRRAGQATAQLAEVGESSADDILRGSLSTAGRKSSEAVRALEHMENPLLQSVAQGDDIARAAAIRESPGFAEQGARVYRNAVESVPGKVAGANEAVAEHAANVARRPELVEEGIAAARKNSGVLHDSWDLFKSHGEPYAAMILGDQVGEMLGHDDAGMLVGALVGGRTRGMRKAGRLMKKPANQERFFGGLERMLSFDPARSGQAGNIAAQNYARMFPKLSHGWGMAGDEHDDLLARR